MQTLKELTRAVTPHFSNSVAGLLRPLFHPPAAHLRGAHVNVSGLAIPKLVGSHLKAKNTSPAVSHRTGATSHVSSHSGAGSSIGHTLLGNVLSFLPLVSGIARLFGGGPSRAAALPQYHAPARETFAVAVKNGVFGDATYSNANSARISPVIEVALSGLNAQRANATAANIFTGSSVSASRANSSVVQASLAQHSQEQSSQGTSFSVQPAGNVFDNQFFLDHGGQIALAVREAMLNMNSLNDVVGDL